MLFNEVGFKGFTVAEDSLAAEKASRLATIPIRQMRCAMCMKM
jgi:hypothetical protein